MTVLHEKLHELRRIPASFAGKIIKGPFSPDPVELINVLAQSEGFIFIYRSLRQPSELITKIFYEEQLKDIELIEQDFGGDPRLFFLALMGYIIQNNYQSDPYFAVGISNIDPLPHQLDAVYNYILPRGRLRFMIADDPGAGKTIMAGLVIKEYIARGLAKRILIVCPGGLISQWEGELRKKFGEHFKAVNREIFKTSRYQNIWVDYPKAITSLDFLKQEDIMGSLETNTWDLVIVDEAHKFSGTVNKDLFEPNERYKLGRVLSAHALNLLFLTATPHKGDPNAYRMLLALLEPDMFGDEYVSYAPDANQQVVDLEQAGIPIFLRRLKETMVSMEGLPLFKKRRSDTITWEISPLETKLYRAVTKYVSENFNKALKDKKTAVSFALKIMQRRLLSSSHAIHNTLEKRAARLQAILDGDEFKKSKEDLAAMEREYQTKLDAEWDDLSERDRERIEQKLLQLSMAKNPEELKQEVGLLRELAAMAEDVKAHPDQETKLWEVKKLLEKHLTRPTDKIIIFTEYTDTLHFIKGWIDKWGFSTCMIHGGMEQDARNDAQLDFEKKKQVCVATEAAGEGINLQFCHLLINYDIPWVPTRLEQRLGRIHRYGQTENCFFMNLVSDRAADGKAIAEGDVLATLLKKIETIREALGDDRVFDVIGDEIIADLSLDQAFARIVNDPEGGFFEIKSRLTGDELKDKIKKALDAARSNMTVNLEAIRIQTKVSQDARFWPEYIEDYVKRSLDMLGGHITATRTIAVPTQIQEYFPATKPRYEQITFTKPKPSIYESSTEEYITVGHPLLDGLTDYFSEKGRVDTRRGAIFLDEHGFGTGLLWFLEQGVVDGKNRVLGKRIGLVFQPFNENLVPQEPSLIPLKKLCDFKANESDLKIELDVDLMKEQARILAFFQGTEGKAYYSSIKDASDRFCGIQEQSSRKAHDYQRGHLVQQLAYLRSQLKDDDLDDKKRESLERRKSNVEKQREVLQKRHDEFMTEITLRRSINSVPPVVLGLGLVLPGDPSGKYDREFVLEHEQRVKRLRELVDKHKVDETAMQLVLEYEKKCGRKPINVKNINCGYDIESSNPSVPGDMRRIEVKGHTEAADEFISNNEFKMGLRYGNAYWLYVVEYAFESPVLRPMQNPALVFFENVTEIQRTTYKIARQAIDEKCERIKL